MNVDECLEKGLLKNISPSSSLALKSLGVAKRKLAETKKILDLELLNVAYTNLYTCFFHASRALLFNSKSRK